MKEYILAFAILLTQPLVSLLDDPAAYYCPPSQRYDIAKFPPRCIDCPNIVPNEMSLAQIPTQLRISRGVQKFSPGLPQNQTCGCWRAAVNQSIVTAGLNASWVVSGLVFSSSRGRWLKEINVGASDDNATFIDWGNYSFQNYSDAALTIFNYPIRARFFRITVLRYANHYISASTGFPLNVQALVSNTQPFTCRCPLLSSGFCCPYPNMTVRNDKCVWCMDPTKISTVVVDGCGKCKPGTFEYQGKCYYQPQVSAISDFQVSNPKSNGVYWSADLNFSADAQTLVSLFLTNQTNGSRPCIQASCSGLVRIYSQWSFDGSGIVPLDTHLILSQYLQFDRGRYTLNMTEPVIRSWASCPDNKACNGVMVALFATVFRNSTSYRTQELTQSLKFEMGVQSLVLSGGGTPTLMLAHMELHYFQQMDAWMVYLIGTEWNNVYVQWDQDQPMAAVQQDNFIPVKPPPQAWSSLRVSNELNSSALVLQQPVTVVTHGALDSFQYSGIMVRIQYGLGFASTPSPGDSEQLVFVTAKSPSPIRLKTLSTTVQNGAPFVYTTSKGFIIDAARVLDLSLSCSLPTSTLIKWLSNAIMVLPDSPPRQMTSFISQSCNMIQSGAVSKAYWLVPAAASTRRTDAINMQVVAEFV